LGGPFFSLAHFYTFHTLITLFPSCLFPFVTYDIHIIGPTLIVSQVFHHYFFELDLVSLAIQPYKCVVWFPSRLPLRFLPPSSFYTPIKGIRVLGVLLGSISFTSYFLRDVLDYDVQHIDVFQRLGMCMWHFEFPFVSHKGRITFFVFYSHFHIFNANLLLFDFHSLIWKTFKARFF